MAKQKKDAAKASAKTSNSLQTITVKKRKWIDKSKDPNYAEVLEAKNGTSQ